MDGSAAYNARSVEEVYRDFKGRRAGIIRALTTDVEDFYQQCDPERENLCLYGFPNEQWEVNLPAEEVPPEFPEPALGINFARDGMQEKDWISLVAVHSDAWLLAVAFYFGARFGFDKNERKRLFSMINDLPTIFEVVSGKKQVRTSGTNNHINNANHSNSNSKVVNIIDQSSQYLIVLGYQLDAFTGMLLLLNAFHQDGSTISYMACPQATEHWVKTHMLQKSSESQAKYSKSTNPKEEEEGLEEDEEEHGETLCGACGENYASDEFWICCDICERWFHGKCVKITPAKAEHIKQYKCPSCSNKKVRPS
ncbi:hypothetical protein Taro_007341 [Colocasia esculenta]|uniref:PHD finger protein ALFIN-LIKE n=1 Tax=Colocasia esculenta TaxID=4460 RepID=A0A843TXW7_COLES|nr:hypothetical protein [Colocasia esculenta]